MRPVDLVLRRLEGVRSRADGGYVALCPAHEDTKPSLGVSRGNDGRALVRCFAGCPTGRVVEALGLRMSDLFERHGGRGEGGAPAPPQTSATAQPCTIVSYAQAKGLPLEFLEGLGLSDAHYMSKRAVRIPYLGQDCSEAAVRFRLALEKSPSGDDRFRWRKGSRPLPYGLWRLGHAREEGHVFLVEGESDAQTLWLHGVPALGVPGASAWRNEWAEYLQGVEKVYAVVEPDAGGEAFWGRLAASPLRESLYRVRLDGAGDASDLYQQDPARFAGRLDGERSRAVAWLDLAESEAQERSREAWAACEHLALAPDILELFAADLRRCGVAGEDRMVKLLYLIVTSRMLERVVSAAVKGPSSGGKTYTVERVLGFFPDDAYYALTAMSERALAYSEEPIQHRFLVVYEAAGMSGEFATYLIRSLLSEGRLRYETVESTSEGLRPRTIEREGPTGLIVTTTEVKLHPENETRLISLAVSDTQEQTRDVLLAMADEDREKPDMGPWHDLQRWLEAAEHRVTIPYATDLAALIPPVAVRLRRDFATVLTFVRTHAMLHQANRGRDARRRIVASLDDYASVRELIADLVSEGVDAVVPATVRETVETVERLSAEPSGNLTVSAVAAALNLDKSAALRRVRAATDRGYLKNLENRKGRPARLASADPLPEDVEILPAREKLRGCAVAGDSGGTKPPPSVAKKRGGFAT